MVTSDLSGGRPVGQGLRVRADSVRVLVAPNARHSPPTSSPPSTVEAYPLGASDVFLANKVHIDTDDVTGTGTPAFSIVPVMGIPFFRYSSPLFPTPARYHGAGRLVPGCMIC